MYKNYLLNSIGLGSENELLNKIKSEKEFVPFLFPEIDNSFSNLSENIVNGTDEVSDIEYKIHSSIL